MGSSLFKDPKIQKDTADDNQRIDVITHREFGEEQCVEATKEFLNQVCQSKYAKNVVEVTQVLNQNMVVLLGFTKQNDHTPRHYDQELDFHLFNLAVQGCISQDFDRNKRIMTQAFASSTVQVTELTKLEHLSSRNQDGYEIHLLTFSRTF